MFNIAVADLRRDLCNEEEEDASSQPVTRKHSKGSDEYARKILGSGHRCPSEWPYEATKKGGDPIVNGQSRASENRPYGERYQKEVDAITAGLDFFGVLEAYSRCLQAKYPDQQYLLPRHDTQQSEAQGKGEGDLHDGEAEQERTPSFDSHA